MRFARLLLRLFRVFTVYFMSSPYIDMAAFIILATIGIYIKKQNRNAGTTYCIASGTQPSQAGHMDRLGRRSGIIPVRLIASGSADVL
jgi:hypothetical protein